MMMSGVVDGENGLGLKFVPCLYHYLYRIRDYVASYSRVTLPLYITCVVSFVATQIPRSTEGKEWFWYIDKDVDLPIIQGAMEEFMKIYVKSPHKLKMKLFRKDEPFEKKLKADDSNSSEQSDLNDFPAAHQKFLNIYHQQTADHALAAAAANLKSKINRQGSEKGDFLTCPPLPSTNNQNFIHTSQQQPSAVANPPKLPHSHTSPVKQRSHKMHPDEHNNITNINSNHQLHNKFIEQQQRTKTTPTGVQHLKPLMTDLPPSPQKSSKEPHQQQFLPSRRLHETTVQPVESVSLFLNQMPITKSSIVPERYPNVSSDSPKISSKNSVFFATTTSNSTASSSNLHKRFRDDTSSQNAHAQTENRAPFHSEERFNEASDLLKISQHSSHTSQRPSHSFQLGTPTKKPKTMSDLINETRSEMKIREQSVGAADLSLNDNISTAVVADQSNITSMPCQPSEVPKDGSGDFLAQTLKNIQEQLLGAATDGVIDKSRDPFKAHLTNSNLSVDVSSSSFTYESSSTSIQTNQSSVHLHGSSSQERRSPSDEHHYRHKHKHKSSKGEKKKKKDKERDRSNDKEGGPPPSRDHNSEGEAKIAGGARPPIPNVSTILPNAKFYSGGQGDTLYSNPSPAPSHKPIIPFAQLSTYPYTNPTNAHHPRHPTQTGSLAAHQISTHHNSSTLGTGNGFGGSAIRVRHDKHYVNAMMTDPPLPMNPPPPLSPLPPLPPHNSVEH